MNKSVALFLSYLIHPAIMPVLGVAIILFFSPVYLQRELFVLTLLYVFAGTYVFPLLMVFLLKKLGIISSIHLVNASERRYPFLASILFYFLTAQSVRNFPVPEIIAGYILAGTLMLVVLWAFLRLLKLSAHMAGIGALMALLLIISITYQVQLLAVISLLIIAAGFLASARLLLKAHSPVEVYLGFMVGFACVCIVLGGSAFRILNESAIYTFDSGIITCK